MGSSFFCICIKFFNSALENYLKYSIAFDKCMYYFFFVLFGQVSALALPLPFAETTPKAATDHEYEEENVEDTGRNGRKRV